MSLQGFTVIYTKNANTLRTSLPLGSLPRICLCVVHHLCIKLKKGMVNEDFVAAKPSIQRMIRSYRNASPIILIIDRNSSIIYNHYGIGYYIMDEIENFLKKRKMSETGLTTLLRIPG